MTTEENKQELEKEAVDPSTENETNTVLNTVETTEEAVKPAKKSSSSVAEHEDFDWSMDKEGFSTYSENELSSMANNYTNTFSNIEENQVVTGKIVAFSGKDVVVNVGFKSDGIVPANEFKNIDELKVGDEIELFVEHKEDANGQLILSRRKARQEHAWGDIVKAMEEEITVTGHVKSRTKGGLVVDIYGIDTFLPGSQIDIKPIRDYDVYVGKDMEFKVVKINEQFKNVVISHKALIEDDIEAQKSDILSKMEKGQILEGIVKNMTSFGVFVDLGGIDGLLHITDISWSRISNPEEVLSLDEKITVVVLDFDDEKKRISLGLKQLQEHPWSQLDPSLAEGSKVTGKVVTLTDYGAFIEVASGVEGLVHVSEMSWSQHLRNPNEFLKVGDDVEAIVLALDKDEHKMSLGIKQLVPDPWAVIGTKFKVGTKHKGIIKNLTNYGVFVELEEGVDGLLHVSDLSWNKKINHPAEFVKKDQELEVLVLDVDMENRRLSLGHKQLEENPWDTFETIFNEGSRHNGSIATINDKGATVQLDYGIEGFVPTRHLKKADKTNPKVDEVLEMEVIEFNKENRRIILSHTNLWKAEERENDERDQNDKADIKKRTTKTIKNLNSNVERSTLGEMGGGLAELKAALEKAESAPTKAKKVEAKAEPKTEAKAESKVEAKTEVKAKSKVETKVKAETKVEPNIEKVTKEKATAKKVSKGDDLKAISKIGPAFEKRLNALGISTYKDLANLTEAKIVELEKADSMTSIEQWNVWIEEAKKLA